MIVTRRWLEEFIDLSNISDEKLYETFNSIGLEVDSIKKIEIPPKVVVGRIVECAKHPDADKLNLCKIDVGEKEPLQIICGAANVRYAEYVPVAVIGATLPGDFHIKPAKLRGVESFGMVCSSSELGLPKMGDGIMILDSSIGELIPGKELREYDAFNDTVIELELTANRGDCLSIRGVARDLSAIFNRDLKPFEYHSKNIMKKGIAREFKLHTEGEIESDISFMIIESKECDIKLSDSILLALCDAYKDDAIDAILSYTIHATGVIIRAYNADILKNSNGRVELTLKGQKAKAPRLFKGDKEISIVGISIDEEYKASSANEEILIEASYTEPDILVDTVATERLKSDELYYRSSRGSEPNLIFGVEYLQKSIDRNAVCEFSTDIVKVEKCRRKRVASISISKLNSIIGQEISKSTIHKILSLLGFEIQKGVESDVFIVKIPPHRHDIVNVFDIAEEVLRIVGINNIEAKPLEVVEKNRLSKEAKLYKIRRDFRQKAVSAGFYEALTYAFGDSKKLTKYQFGTLRDGVNILNPIVEEMDTLRSTLLINLLDAVKRNTSYGKKMIPLFEIGAVFDRDRVESEKIAFVWCGDLEEPSVSNAGKPPKMDIFKFVEKISSVVGALEFRELQETPNALLHPYQSAVVLKDSKEIGYIGQLHPVVAEEFDIDITFIAELDFDAFVEGIKQASTISNYQGTYKDLSILVDKDMPYSTVEAQLNSLDEELIKRAFPIDIYSDEKLGDKKSLTVRFYLQSMDKTLEDSDIESVMGRVLKHLESSCGAVLR